MQDLCQGLATIYMIEIINFLIFFAKHNRLTGPINEILGSGQS